jgi:hypothetical protein
MEVWMLRGIDLCVGEMRQRQHCKNVKTKFFVAALGGLGWDFLWRNL